MWQDMLTTVSSDQAKSRLQLSQADGSLSETGTTHRSNPLRWTRCGDGRDERGSEARRPDKGAGRAGRRWYGRDWQDAVGPYPTHIDTSKHTSPSFWLNATTEATLKDSFRKMAELIFEVQDSQVLKGEEVVKQVHRWLSDTHNTRWLLIFDNYDDPDEFQLDAYYPATSHGSIVITSRRPDRVGGRKMAVQPSPRCGRKSGDLENSISSKEGPI